MKRIIFHVDVNSAFLSWEAAYRVQMGKDDLRLIPSAIGGDREKRTGVILAKSIPAKKYGIKTGEPVAMALRKCPHLYLAKPNFKLYKKYSDAFVEICRRYAPVVEKYSIDECFLDMTGTEYIYPDLINTAYDIKNEIKNTLGFTVNIGVGSNKLLAKMASDFEKPDKVHTLFEDEIEEKMWCLPIRELFTVGRSTAEKLQKSYISTIGDLARSDLRRVQILVGNKLGETIHAYANGRDDSSVLSHPDEAKGYSVSTTLEEDITTLDYAKKVLLALTDSVSSRLRADGAQAYCVAVTIRGNDFKDKSHQRKLSEPTDVTLEIFKIAVSLFSELWDKHTPLRLVGIALTNVTRESGGQTSFFENKEKEKHKKIDRAVDRIRGRFGSDTIVRGSSYEADLDVGRKYKTEKKS